MMFQLQRGCGLKESLLTCITNFLLFIFSIRNNKAMVHSLYYWDVVEQRQ